MHCLFFSLSGIQFSSVQFSCLVGSDSLRPHGLQHARLPCPSPASGACSNSCPSSQWCHPTISSSIVPFSSHPVFPSVRVFSKESVLCIRWPSIRVSALASVLPMNIQDWLDLLAVQGTLKSLFHHHSSKASILQHSAFFIIQLSHPLMTTGKTKA